MKVVLDTNVLIAGLFSHGPPAAISKAWRDGVIQFVLSSEIIDEYIKVSRILADGFPVVEIRPILTMIVTRSEIIQATPFPYQVCEDPDDDKFLACAISSESRIIISGDKHLLKLSGYRGIKILTPRAFIEQYLKRQP